MNQIIAAKRNNNIDILKFICAIFVMIIHVKTPYYPYYEPIVRSGVPCFFIISGFFLYTENCFREKLKKAIYKICRLLLWSTFVFFLYSLFLALATSNFSAFNFTPRRIISIIFFNASIFGIHLWYIGAYLYVLVIFYFIETHFKIKSSLLFMLVPIFLLCACCLSKYSLLLTGHEISTMLTRNFLFAGIPYFLIGIFIKKYYSKIKNIAYVHKVASCCIIFFMVTSVLEKYFLFKFRK